MSKKISQKEMVLNYLKSSPNKKITAVGAKRITNSKSVNSMNFLLPTMLKEGLITRIKTGTYKLAGSAPVAVSTKKTIKAAKTVRKVFTTESTIKSKLLAKKEELLSQVSNIDKHIDAIDKVYALSSKLLK